MHIKGNGKHDVSNSNPITCLFSDALLLHYLHILTAEIFYIIGQLHSKTVCVCTQSNVNIQTSSIRLHTIILYRIAVLLQRTGSLPTFNDDKFVTHTLTHTNQSDCDP